MRTRRTEKIALASAPMTRAVDVLADLCNRARCFTTVDGTLMYRDSDHLSVEGSLRLTGRFSRAIRAAVSGSRR